MARLLALLLRLPAPVIAWTVVQVFGRIPAWPFLALTPARTAFGRSASVALLLAGVLGIVALLSLSSGTWLHIAAIIMAAGVTVGCGRAFATFWWPATLGGALLGMGLGLAWLPRFSPWALRIDGQSAQVPILIVGGFGLIALAFLSTAMTVEALQALKPPEQPAGHPGKGGSQPLGSPKRRRRSGKSRDRR
jgi:hypothetical protein